MTDFNQALDDIRKIRLQVAQTTEFRGYGPLTLGATAGIAVLAGAAQRHWLPAPAMHHAQYVALWLGTGLVSATVILAQMLTRANRLHSGMADAMVRRAVTDFLPAGLTGLVLPFVLLRGPENVFWMLPGLWQIVFGLGVLASCRSLPRAMVAAGVWFLATGLGLLALGSSGALSPVGMALPFGVGMALVAGIHSLSARKASAVNCEEEDDDEED